jgi:uncharacterized membrane protein YhaH (DUF805 family)
MTPRDVLELLFGFRETVSRRTYATAGFSLFALKYAGDYTFTRAFAEVPIDPAFYLNPILSQRLQGLGSYPSWLPAVLIVWALPFIWVGVGMSARRAADSGLTPWLCLVFFVPVVNYLLMLALCVAGPSGIPERNTELVADARPPLRVALLSLAVAGAFGLLGALLSVFGLKSYGSSLFILIPFLVGVIAGVLMNLKTRSSVLASVGVALLAITIPGAVMLLFALEGLLCLGMAAVVAYPLTGIGAVVGHALSLSTRPGMPTVTMLSAWPVFAFAEPQEFPVGQVVSSIEIAVPPERVWPHVVGFSELPPPSEWLLRTGVACPLRARIVGEGVGAIRYCEFTTGPFVEPITAWEPPRRLAFDVSTQPPSMHEWSPYEVVHAPHLAGSMQSLRGEFRLVPLAGGRTRLEGTTWYRLKMSPNAYWSFYVERAVEVIHHRVLEHVRRLSEQGGQ